MDYLDTYKPAAADPAVNAVAIAPDNTDTFEQASRALWIGTPGNLHVTMLGGQDVVFPNMQAGWAPIRVSRVYATGTTAAGIVAVW